MTELDEALLRADPPVRVFVACTGAGASIQHELWQPPGASAYLVGGAFPYAKEETDRFLGFSPPHYTSRETALELAMAAFMRAAAAAKGYHRSIGLGLCASVASLKEHRGDHGVFAACVDHDGARIAHKPLPRAAGGRARAGDDENVRVTGLAILRDALRIKDSLYDDIKVEPVTDEELRAPFFERSLFLATGRRTTRNSDYLGSRHVDGHYDRVVFVPGAFDPVHKGHLGMAASCERVSGRRAVFWVTAATPHKPPLLVPDMLRRASQFAGAHDVLFTESHPLYVDKARRFSGAHFAIGADAAARMMDPKWGIANADLLAHFRKIGTKFYVFGRGGVDPAAVGPADVFQPMAETWDVSSKALREAAK